MSAPVGELSWNVMFVEVRPVPAVFLSQLLLLADKLQACTSLGLHST